MQHARGLSQPLAQGATSISAVCEIQPRAEGCPIGEDHTSALSFTLPPEHNVLQTSWARERERERRPRDAEEIGTVTEAAGK